MLIELAGRQVDKRRQRRRPVPVTAEDRVPTGPTSRPGRCIPDGHPVRQGATPVCEAEGCA
jgi:hypothetical protein